jgi:hypothetical protein
MEMSPSKNVEIDMVSGNDDAKYQPEVHRSNGAVVSFLFNLCGRSGRWMEPKE